MWGHGWRAGLDLQGFIKRRMHGHGGKTLPCHLFRKCVDVALEDTGQWWPGQCGGMVALDGLRGLFQPLPFHGSMETSL